MLTAIPVLLVGLCLATPQSPPAQQAAPTTQTQVRTLFHTGQDQQVIAVVTGAKGKANRLAPLLFVAAQSYERLRQRPEARAVYARLAGYPENSPWRAIGESNVLIAERKFLEAVAAANRAVTLAPNLAEAHFNLGRALGYTDEFALSAASFEQAARLDANMAYAYYYAGLAQNQAKRVDLMARNFETFLRLAPQAPERARVESIMRTIRD